MRTLRTVAELRTAVAAARAEHRSVALVPTMGALHEGHLSLIRAAAGAHDLVVVSLFVNPTQFDDGADLAAYPRDEARDAELAAQAGGHVLFAPSSGEVHPHGFATTVRLRGPLTETLEGAHRGPQHFDGVTTVVTKLLTICAPDVAFFGAKDAQQLRVVRRLVRDLDLPVEIVAGPTIRDADGLALSSRNTRLTPAMRERALGLSRALAEVCGGLQAGRYASIADAEAAGLRVLLDHRAEPEYLSVVDPETMAPADAPHGDLLIVAAARVDAVRLIDNVSLTVPAAMPHAVSTKQAQPCSA